MIGWRWVPLLAMVSGCFFELRGSSGSPRRTLHDSAQVGAEGDLALGLGYIDKQQTALVETGVGNSPLQPRDPMQSQPSIATVGARYEHAIGRPWLRAYGRAMLGFNFCEMKSDGTQDETCKGASDQGVTITTVGAGLELALAEDAKDNELVGNMAGVGIGIVYQSVHDATLGPGSFIGVELSLLMGGDLLTAVSDASRKHD
jgi:hypothetical protein